MKTPILFLIFNRPDTTKRVFQRIRQAKPKVVFVAADGPRSDKPNEAQLCKETRSIVTENIDWDCEVYTLFRDHNLGCGNAVSEAIQWFFEHVEEGIILEDDCLPESTFFPYCSKLLEIYRNSDQVKMISGFNYFHKRPRLWRDDYFFSNYFSIWGWASWKNRIEQIDWAQNSSQTEEKFDVFREHFEDSVISEHLHKMYLKSIKGELDTWDIKMVTNFIQSNGLCAFPLKNQVSNIGFSGTRSTSRNVYHLNSLTLPIDVFKLKEKKVAIDTKTNKDMLKILRNIIHPPRGIAGYVTRILKHSK